MPKSDNSRPLQSVALYGLANGGRFLFPLIAFGIALYNRLNERTLTLDIISGLVLGGGVICYFKIKEFNDYCEKEYGWKNGRPQ